MHYYEVAPNKIVRPDSATFTYASEKTLLIGQIVTIEVGKKSMVGVVMRKTTKPSYDTKLVSDIIEPAPLPVQLVNLSVWLSEYYLAPLANVLQTILPNGIKKDRRVKPNEKQIIKRNRTNIVFNKGQLEVLKTIEKGGSGTYLLHGITGSGKTEVYIELAKQAIKDGKSVIVLVPEIALTSQLISEFSNHFTDLIVTHSKMTESNRHTVWKDALNSHEPRVIIGPRSALFSPLHDIGLIVVDEAHEPSYKQDQSPKYSALRVATMLGRFHKAKVVFGSATPSVTDRYLAEQSKRPILKLDKLARSGSVAPNVELIDMTKRLNFSGHRFLSKQLIEQIEKTLKSKKQVLIFHNRRGSASTTLCESCGWTAECPKCYLPLTLHADKHSLFCHICGYKTPVPTSCPICNDVNIIHKGIGTKLIESEIRKLFPHANIARFDADNKDEESVNSRYKELYDGSIDIAIGTQIIAKGLDLPHLRLVGVIQADAGLAIPDFNTNERTFQLLAQVIGRVGRNEHSTNVVVQTYKPTHPSIVYGLSQDYESFYSFTLEERKKGLFPPFTHLLKLTCVFKTESAAISNSQKFAKEIKNKSNSDIKVFGPVPAFYERQGGMYRWQLFIKSHKREFLLDVLKLLPPKSWQSELDPTSLL